MVLNAFVVLPFYQSSLLTHWFGLITAQLQQQRGSHCTNGRGFQVVLAPLKAPPMLLDDLLQPVARTGPLHRL